MSQTFNYSPGPFNLAQLSDELITGGVTLELLRGNDSAAEVTVGDAVSQATVDAIVAAHVADYRLPWEKDLDAHEADSDPHPTYLTAAEGNAAYDAAGAASSAVSAHEGASDPHTGYQKESEKGAASGYASLDANTRVPTAQLGTGTADNTTYLRGDGAWSSVTGDPWTKVKLATTYTTSQSSVQDVGLAFTPVAAKTYLIEVILLIQSSDATNGIMPGVAWPSNTDDGAGHIMQVGATVGATVQTWFTHGTNSTTAATTTPNANTTYMAHGRFILSAGASSSGDFKIQVKSENNGTNVSVMAGSLLLHREV